MDQVTAARIGKRPSRRGLWWTLGAGLAAGAASVGWAAFEAHRYTLNEVTVPLLPDGQAPVKILHISDIHMIPGQVDKIAWIRDLAATNADLVINTGDNFGHRDALWPTVHALESLLTLPGVFVFGSNDYFAPTFRNPLRYLWADTSSESHAEAEPDLPWRQFAGILADAGWLNLNNARGSVALADSELDFVGLDDPHIGRDSLPLPDSASTNSVRIGVVHAPYRRALDALHADGAQLIVAGHTHGGQVCVPGVGALTTNCDLDNARASGLHGWPGARPDEREGTDSSWLNVSQGVGTNPFFRLRLACTPGATLMTLTSRNG